MIYFDNASTYFLKDKSVLDYFSKCYKSFFANSSSNHYLGFITNKILDRARLDVLNLLKININDYDVIFNSGATEGINHAIKGYALKNRNRGNEIIAFVNEHLSVLETLKELSKYGFKITYVSCTKNGEVNYHELKNKINNNTILVVVMAVNNEIGSINNISKIFNIKKKYPKCIFFSDVTQGIGKINIDFNKIDMFVFSAHKIGGLIGSGVLIKKKKILLEKIIVGGNQENNYRSGTVSVPLALTTVYVLDKSIKNLQNNFNYVNSLKKTFVSEISKINEIEINSYHNFPYIINFSLKLKKASVLIEAFSTCKIYVSSLSACSDKKNTISYVLMNMKKPQKIAENSVRVSFSHENNLNEISIFIKKLKQILKNIKNV